MIHNPDMTAKPMDRYGGKLRPFILLTPAEDKAIAHASIDAELVKPWRAGRGWLPANPNLLRFWFSPGARGGAGLSEF